MDDRNEQGWMTGRIIAGIILIAVGIAFTLDSLDMLEIDGVWRFWPLILVAIGLGKLMTPPVPGKPREGYWMLFIGLWLLAAELHIFGLSYHNSWPILIIGVGISMLLRPRCERKWDSAPGSSNHVNGN
ncbi:MAG: LiaI-LiaF-like domain-containing protein [Thermoanaerobaculia bacterium]